VIVKGRRRRGGGRPKPNRRRMEGRSGFDYRKNCVSCGFPERQTYYTLSAFGGREAAAGNPGRGPAMKVTARVGTASASARRLFFLLRPPAGAADCLVPGERTLPGGVDGARVLPEPKAGPRKDFRDASKVCKGAESSASIFHRRRAGIDRGKGFAQGQKGARRKGT